MTTEPTFSSAVTVPAATLKAFARTIADWTSAVYPGDAVRVEAATRDPDMHRPHTWHVTARLSNGVRLRFTLVVASDEVARITRHARLASGEAHMDVDARLSARRPPPRRRDDDT